MVPSTNIVTRRGENEYPRQPLGIPAQRHLQRQRLLPQRYRVSPNPTSSRTSSAQPSAGPSSSATSWFFFGSYQGTRQVNGLDPTSVANLILPRSPTTAPPPPSPRNSVPTTTPAINKLSLLCRRKTNRLPQPQHRNHLAHQPSSPPPAASQGSRRLLPHPLPANPRSLRVLMPDLGFSSYSLPSTYKENHFIGNTDYVLSPRHTISGRVFAATVDQLRTFGSPGGYPGAPVVPGWGAPQALTATDVATSAAPHIDTHPERRQRRRYGLHAE